MTSKLTRERLAEIAQFGFSSAITPANDFEIKELARIALAAMNGEPFAYIIQDKYERERGVEGHLSRSHVSKYVSQEDINEHEITCIPLYRHAQLAPVVPAIPDEMTSEQAYEIGDYHGDPVDVFARGANWMRQHIIDSISAATSQEEKP